MSQASVLIDSGSAVALSTATVFPTLPGAVTGTGTAIAYQTTMADLITFMGSNDGPFVYDSGTIAVSTPGLSITETWNAGGVTFKAIVASITDTSSAAGSLLVDLAVGGASVFTVSKVGAFTATGASVIRSGALSLTIGADANLNTVTTATDKTARFGMPHYTSASEEPVAFIHGTSTTSTNAVNIGGGTSTMNAATQVAIYTAANNTTTTGTLWWRVTSTGVLTGDVQPTAVGTTPGTSAVTSVMSTAQGGNTTIATTGTGGVGGAFSLTTGAGGTAAAAVTAATGGNGGAITLTTGAGTAVAVAGAGTGTGGNSGAFGLVTGVGGAASTSTGANVGGNSGAFSITTGVGGAATDGSANTGGNSGAIALTTGNAGAGATADGVSGTISLITGTAGAGGTVGTILLRPAGTTRLAATTAGIVVTGTATVSGAFGCNGATAQTAASIGAALAAYATGAFGLDSDANMLALYNDVVAIRAALVANGILTP